MIDKGFTAVSEFKKIIPLLLILALALALRGNSLSLRSLWTDEFLTILISTGHAVDSNKLLGSISDNTFPKLLKAKDFKVFLRFDPDKGLKDVSEGLLRTDVHPPLYFWIIHLWIELFGSSATAIRSFSVLMGIVAVFLSYKLGYIFFGRGTGIACALFVSISPFCVRLSQEARSYSLVMVIGLLAWLAALRIEKYNKNSDILWFTLINAAGLYTHYFYSFIGFAQFCYLTVFYRKDKARLDKIYLAFLGSLVLFAPWLDLVMLHGYNFKEVEWIFGYGGLIKKVLYLITGAKHYFAMFGESAFWHPGFILAVVLLFLMLAFSALSKAGKFRRQIVYCVFIFLVPLLGLFFIDALQNGALLSQGRFWLFPLLGFIPLAGFIINNGLSKKRTIVCVLVILMVISASGVRFVSFGPATKYTSSWINEESKGYASIVLCLSSASNTRLVVLAQAYYLDDDIILTPVRNVNQFNQILNLAKGRLDKVFIVTHANPSDCLVTEESFSGANNLGAGLKLETVSSRDFVYVSELTPI